MTAPSDQAWLFLRRPSADGADDGAEERKAIERETGTATRSFVELMMEEAARVDPHRGYPMDSGIARDILQRAIDHEAEHGPARRAVARETPSRNLEETLTIPPGWEYALRSFKGPAGRSRNGQWYRNPPGRSRELPRTRQNGPVRPWEPTQPPEPRPVRREVWRLRGGLRRYAQRSERWHEAHPEEPKAPRSERWMPRAFGACGSLQAGEAVELVAAADGRVGWRGIATCGLVWECPVCQMTIKAARADQIAQLLTWHGHDGANLLTLTVRHGMGESLRRMRKGIANAWRAMARGRPWEKFRQAIGYVGSVRALEVSHGPNGWHPHLHVLILGAPDWDGASMPDGLSVDDWLVDRWATMVERYVGEDNIPEPEHGVGWTPCRDDGRYLAKLGLEVSDPGRKASRPGHRNPWEIAADLIEHRRTADRKLWHTYCEAMHGARQLTWSAGLREQAGIRDATDQELASMETGNQETTHVLTVSGEEWLAIVHRSVELEKQDGARVRVPAPILIVEIAERKGATGARRLLRSLVAAAEQQRERDVKCSSQNPKPPGG